jgi:nucleotide-binding universal stress UspA family protein
MGTIVVGMDGSEGSRKALRWALEHAARLGDDVRVVHAYEFRLPWREFAYAEGMSPQQMAVAREATDREAEETRRYAEELLRSAVSELADGRVAVEQVALHHHHPAAALVEQSEHADLLVVGSRGRGGFAGLLLGSVSQQCLHHAKCPVVVVPSGS